MPKRSPTAAEPAAPKRAAAPRQTKTAKMSPLDYMLQVLRDPEASPAERKWAAEKAAPYLHPRLQSVEHGGEVSLRHEDLLEELE
ncbi:MAG: hypothetical protein Tsb0032_00240 [Kiloniellaceae bacterium]